MKIEEFYQNKQLYNGFCAFQKNLNIFTVWVSVIVVCLSFIDIFAPNFTDVIMAFLHNLNFFDDLKGGNALDPTNFANLKIKKWLLIY